MHCANVHFVLILVSRVCLKKCFGGCVRLSSATIDATGIAICTYRSNHAGCPELLLIKLLYHLCVPTSVRYQQALNITSECGAEMLIGIIFLKRPASILAHFPLVVVGEGKYFFNCFIDFSRFVIQTASAFAHQVREITLCAIDNR